MRPGEHQPQNGVVGHHPIENIHAPLWQAALVMVDFEAELWIWDARQDESWTFVSLPADAAAEIRELTAGLRRGFGSVRVRVTIGATTWTTSIFPDKTRDTYVLPLKRAVRKAESLEAGDTTGVSVTILDL